MNKNFQESLNRVTSPINPLAGRQTYQPETWLMKKDTIYAAREMLRIGLENTEELLYALDTTVGRTISSTRLHAEQLEREIQIMKDTLALLKEPDGMPLGSGII